MPLRGCALRNAPGCCGNQGSRGVSAGLGGAPRLFSPPFGPGRAAAVREGGGVPLPWQGCASRAHSSPGWERPRDTRRGGGDGGGRKRRGGGQDEGGDSDKTNQDFWGWSGEFGICSPHHSHLSPHQLSGRSASPPAFSLGFKPPVPSFRGRDPQLPTRKPCN